MTETQELTLMLYGIDHHLASLKEREKFADEEKLKEALASIKTLPEVKEATYLFTCNRTEFYLLGWLHCREALDQLFASLFPELNREKLSICVGKKAVAHLFQVASGADSMVVGETQILSQVKGVLSLLLKEKSAPVLTALFRQAVHAGKRCRSETSISRGNLSVPHLAQTLARNIFGNLKEVSVLLVGAGEMGQLTAQVFRDQVRHLFVTSRSTERVRHLSRKLNTNAIAFDQALTQLKTVDVLITCTGAPKPIFHKPEMEKVMRQRKFEPLFVLDLAVPRDVDPTAEQIENIYLYNIDDLQEIAAREKEHRKSEIERVNLIVEQETKNFLSWYHGLKAKDLIIKFKSLAEQAMQQELTKKKGFLTELTPEQREKVKQLLCQSMNRFLHQPLKQLKALSQDSYHEKVYLEALRQLFEVDLE